MTLQKTLANIAGITRGSDPAKSILCPYCPFEYRLDSDMDTLREALKAHIADCAQHPTRRLLEVLKAGRDLAGALVKMPLPVLAEAIPDLAHWREEANKAIAAAEPAKPKVAKRKAKR